MKTKVLLLSVFVLSLVFSNQILAQNTNYQNHQNHQKECFLDDLSDAQKISIEAIKLESQKKVKFYKADLKIKKAELNKLEIAEEPSIDAINSKIDEITVVKADIQKENASARIAIRNDLTPAQKVKFDMHHTNKNNKRYHDGVKSHQGDKAIERKHLNPDCKYK